MINIKVSNVTAFTSGDISADLYVENLGPGGAALDTANGYGFSIVDKAGKKVETKPKNAQSCATVSLPVGASKTIHVQVVADVNEFSQKPTPAETYELIAHGLDPNGGDRIKFRFHPLFLSA